MGLSSSMAIPTLETFSTFMITLKKKKNKKTYGRQKSVKTKDLHAKLERKGHSDLSLTCIYALLAFSFLGF